MRSRRPALALLFALASTPLTAGCAAEVDEVESSEEGLTRVTEAERAAAQATPIDGFAYDRLTPTSARMMRAARWWMGAQDESPRYPKPRMCATNVSKVLFLSGITSFDQEGVRAMLADVAAGGARVHKLPMAHADFVAALNTIDGGHIPAGTLVAGMNIHTSRPGDQHIGMIGHTDPDGTVWIYHNNWYRPENEAGLRKDHMISDENLRRGFPRQWMATPWLRVTRDASGKITRATSLLPALDDMDPFNGNYRITMAVLPQVARELR